MHSTQSAFARAKLNILFLTFAALTATQACLASDQTNAAQRATSNLHATGRTILQQLDKRAHYSPAITISAATVGTLTKQIAKRKCEMSEKKAFFVGMATTSVASLIGQRLQQGDHTAGTIFTQLALDNFFYVAIHHTINFFCPPANKKKAAQNTTPNPEATSAPTTPALPVPNASRADLTAPSLLKARG